MSGNFNEFFKQFNQQLKKSQEHYLETIRPYFEAQNQGIQEKASAQFRAQSQGIVEKTSAQFEAEHQRFLEAMRPYFEQQNLQLSDAYRKVFERAAQDISGTMIENLRTISNPKILGVWHALYLGKRSPIRAALSSIGDIPKQERAYVGQWLNGARTAINDAYKQQETTVREMEWARDLEEGEIDISLPARPQGRGGLHPSTRTHREFQTIWADMGFQVYHSRDVEADEYNFTLLNLPPHHPARDMQDTFYTTDSQALLRTHTSPGQIRAMREFGDAGSKPIRVILPGMCYRQEQVTARSEIQFTQVEGLAIGRNIRMSDLKGTIAEFARRMYNPNAKVRFRASYFPFTEPSMEVDVECFLCGGEGCRVCKYTGWLEIAGSGMVHPTVLRNGGYDPSVWSGFAFGMGPERITMLKHGIQDIRYFWGNDLRFLQQF